MKRLLTMLTLAVVLPVQAEDAAARKVLDCMSANVPNKMRAQSIELEATDAAGTTRTMRGKLYAKRETGGDNAGLMRAMLRINSPDYLAGASYLVRENRDSPEDAMYVYLPSVRRARRVSGGFADGSFLGTNLSYNDLRQMFNSFTGSIVTLEKADKIGERPVHVLHARAAATDVTYTQSRFWVDQKTCVPLRADFYVGKKLRKQLSAEPAALKRSGDFWYFSEAELRDLSDKSRTVVRMAEVSVTPADVADRYFNPTSFHYGN
ncbi:MAG TPA: outer membrane lipoprotein-sorting protein [Solimonas sp.]|nr:outer membrane lipoprotein-sorting protein [Solimonas sp.]